MGLFSALAQCALDFLVEERCHACGRAVDAARFTGPTPALAVPLELATFPLGLTSRLLCADCAGGVERWAEPVSLARPEPACAGNCPIAMYPAFVTDEKLLTVIHLLKFGRHECIAPWLARAMMLALPAEARGTTDGWLVVPVPMDRRARSRRGFNQAESLARTLAAGWELPSAGAGALEKVRRTLPQSALGRAERLTNLEHAFRADGGVVRGTRVILVDDLVTSGATVHACARALRDGGAGEIRVVCAGYRDQQAPLLQS